MIEIKLWVDSHREPDVDWVWAKTAQCALVMLKGGCVERISVAPDQPDLVSPVLKWLDDRNVHPDREVHAIDGGVRYPRGLLQVVIPSR